MTTLGSFRMDLVCSSFGQGKSFPFDIFLSLFPWVLTPNELGIWFWKFTWKGGQGKVFSSNGWFQVYTIFPISTILKLMSGKPSGVKLGIQFISGKCKFPRRWKHTHNIAISHRDIHSFMHIYIYQEIIHHSNSTIKAERRLIRIRQCEVTTGRGTCFHPNVGSVTPNGFTTLI